MRLAGHHVARDQEPLRAFSGMAKFGNLLGDVLADAAEALLAAEVRLLDAIALAGVYASETTTSAKLRPRYGFFEYARRLSECRKVFQAAK